MASDIVMRKEEFEDISISLGNSSYEISSTGEAINGDFSGAIDVGLLGDSAGIVSDQMNSISGSVKNVQNLIKQHSDQIFSYDDYLVKKINEIEIPEDYVIDNPLEINYYTKVTLSKNDGDSVNSGSDAQNTDGDNKATIKEVNLKEMNTEESTQETYDSSSDITSQESLYSINSLGEVSISDTLDESKIDSAKLPEMNGLEPENIYLDTEESRIAETELYELLNKQLLLDADGSVIYTDELYK